MTDLSVKEIFKSLSDYQFLESKSYAKSEIYLNALKGLFTYDHTKILPKIYSIPVSNIN